MSDMLDQIQDFVRRFPITEPQPGHVEVGAMVHEWLARMGTEPSAAPPWGLSPVAAVFGMPIVHRGDMDPREWRLLDRNGDFLAEGATNLPANLPGTEAPASGILDRIDAAVDDWERGPDAMHWSPEPTGGDPTAAATLADFWHFDGRSLDGRIASIWIIDEIHDYLRQALNDRLLWQPADWEVTPGRAGLARDRVHALDREPVPAAALAAADCDPLHQPGWLIDRQREATEVRFIIAAARNPVQERP